MADQGIGSWPRRRARIAPDDTALIYQGRHRSYRELAGRVDRLRERLVALGVAPGDRVAYLGPNQPAFVETMFATMAAGAVFVPLNTRLAVPELAFQLRDAEVRAFVWAESHDETARGVLAESRVGLRVVAGAGSPVADHTLEELVAAGRSGTPEVEVGLDDLAMIMYTSGTTGQPRGAALTHANLTWNVFHVLIDVDVAQADVTLVSAPLFHTAALNQTFLPTFVKGGTSVLESAFDPQRTLELIAEHRITWMFGVPAMFQALTAAPGWRDADLSSVRAVEAGGAPVPEALIRAYQERGLTFMQGYGMTEAAPGVLFLRAADSLRKVGSAGAPCFFTEVDLVSPTGDRVPVGEPGEVVVRGPNVMVGYWRNDAATAEALDADGWLHSGDVAVADEEGHLRIIDRRKDMFISGGENVFPAEVENALHAHPAVRECAVIGVPDAQWGEVGRAYVVVHDGHDLAHPELVEFLSERLARYKIPRSLVRLPELPRTASGKLRKQELRQATGPEPG